MEGAEGETVSLVECRLSSHETEALQQPEQVQIQMVVGRNHMSCSRK